MPEKLRLLQDAITARVKYIGHAAQAQGVDRHLTGLSLRLQDGKEVPYLCSDPVFVRSKRWRVTARHLAFLNALYFLVFAM
jgi:carnitine O-acetyltransferase